MLLRRVFGRTSDWDWCASCSPRSIAMYVAATNITAPTSSTHRLTEEAGRAICSAVNSYGGSDDGGKCRAGGMISISEWVNRIYYGVRLAKIIAREICFDLLDSIFKRQQLLRPLGMAQLLGFTIEMLP